MHRVGIVGSGFIAAEKYLPLFQKLRHRARIVGLCDLNLNVAKKTAAPYGISGVYGDLAAMLSEQTPDLAVICTPPKTHSALAVQAMEKGAHVLVEKPMATTLVECDRMIDASLRFKRKLGVMHNQLFNPAFEEAKRVASSDSFGRFLGMRVFLATSKDYMTSKQNHWAHRLPGGVVGETGPHAVYLSLAFLNEIREVQVHSKKLFSEYPWSIAEDIRINLIADNGISSITLAYGSIQTMAEVDIIGTNGLLNVDLQSRTLIKHKRPSLSPSSIGRSVLSTTCQMSKALAVNVVHYAFSSNLDPHFRGINRFLDYISGGTKYPVTGEEGKRDISMMEIIVQRMRE